MKTRVPYIRILLLTAAILPALLTAAFGQSVGNPVLPGAGSYSIGVGVDQTKYEIDGHDFTMSKALMKVDFDLGKGFDAAFFAGANNLHITYPAAMQRTQFKSRYQLALGGSGKLSAPNPWERDNMLFIEGGGLTFKAIGTSVSEAEANSGEEYYRKFSWFEYWGTAGTIFLLDKFDLYLGYQGRIVHQYEAFSQTDFKSGLKSSGILGIEWKLPNRYALNVQLRVFNGATFSIGLSQAALPGK